MKIVADNTSRVDVFLSKKLDITRNQITNLIKTHGIYVDEKLVKKPSFKLEIGQNIELSFKEPTLSDVTYEVNFDVDILYEDEDILIVNKPPFLTVHPAPSVKEATLVDWLKKKGFSLSTISGEERHGIVHRIDKETSGVLVVAKNNKAHKSLSKQLENKSMGRYYLAIIDTPLKQKNVVEKNIARNPKNRLAMSVCEHGRYAKSAFYPLLLSNDEKKQLIAVKLFTGRTHQIRVHLNSMSRHILGDDLYGFKSQGAKIPRVMLHAYTLYLSHPVTNEPIFIKAPLFNDFKGLCEKYFSRNIDEDFTQDNISLHFRDVDSWL